MRIFMILNAKLCPLTTKDISEISADCHNPEDMKLISQSDVNNNQAEYKGPEKWEGKPLKGFLAIRPDGSPEKRSPFQYHLVCVAQCRNQAAGSNTSGVDESEEQIYVEQ